MEPHSPHVTGFRLLLAAGSVLGGQLRAAEPELRLDLGGGAGTDLVRVHGGEFVQGSPTVEVGRGTDENQRQLRIDADYYLSRSAVTRGQWEYACRAGTTTPWHAGGTPADCDRIIRHQGNSGNTTHPVDSRQPNSWGLVIGGNVWEWCLDWYAPYPAGVAAAPLQDNPNLSDKPRRVSRGGSWLRDAKHSRSAARYRADPRSRNEDIDFRIVCALETTAPAAPLARAGVPAPVPKVEAEPGDPPQQVVPAPAHRPPPVRQRPRRTVRDFGVSGLLGGLVCLAVPLGMVFLLVRMISKHGRRDSGNAFLTRPRPRVARPLIRKCGDGFWIDGDWPAGSIVRLHYVVGGMPVDTELAYRPGPGGQFVDTGTEPETVSVGPGGSAPRSEPALDPVPLEPPPVPEPHEVRPAVSPRPPVFPSAC